MHMRKRLLILALATTAAVPVALLAQDQFQKVKNAKIPEYDETGVLKSMIYANEARVPKQRGATVVEIDGLRIDMYDKDEEVDVTIRAEACKYDRQKRFARSQDRVRIDNDDIEITGREFAYDGFRQRFVIFHEAKVVLKNLQNGSSFIGVTNAPATSATAPETTPQATPPETTP